MDRDEIEKKAFEIADKFQELVFKAAVSERTESKILYQSKFKKRLTASVEEIEEEARKFARNAVPDYSIKKTTMQKLKSYGAYDASEVRLSAYMQIVSGFTKSAEHLEDSLKKFISDQEKKGKTVTVQRMREKIVRELKDTGLSYVQYANGSKQPIDKYAAMLARTARIESHNVNMLSLAIEEENDLVECNIVPNTCDICSIYQGRIYSISGKSTIYPPLYDTAFKKGYSIIHPNCRHQFYPFNSKFRTKKEIEELKTATKRPWKMDGNKSIQQAESARESYANGQAYLRQCNAEQKIYEQMKLYYKKEGLEVPYKNIASFRRSYRSKAGSEGYEKTHHWEKYI